MERRLHAGARGYSATEREQLRGIYSDLEEFQAWEQELEDKRLIRRAEKAEVFLDEISFPNIEDDRNVGKYYWIGTYGNTLLRQEFRIPLLLAVREREPIYRKERRETIDLFVKSVVAITGLVGALIGLVSVLRK